MFTDHKNLISENTQIERVLRWRLLIEEFSPKLVHLAGHKNVVADALSRLELDTSPFLSDQESVMAEIFASEDITPVTYPLQLKRITEFQQKDKELFKKSCLQPALSFEIFFWGQKMQRLTCYKDKIVLPAGLQEPAVQWYHISAIWASTELN